jgi:hypothetical protein
MRRVLALSAAVFTAAVLLPAASTAVRLHGHSAGHGNRTWHANLNLPVHVSWHWHCTGAGRQAGAGRGAIDEPRGTVKRARFLLEAIRPHDKDVLHEFAYGTRDSGQGKKEWRGSGKPTQLRFRVIAHANCDWTVSYRDSAG